MSRLLIWLAESRNLRAPLHQLETIKDILFEYDIINKEFLTNFERQDNYRQLLEAFYTKLPKTESPFYSLYPSFIGSDVITIENLGRFENHILKIDHYQSCYISEQKLILGIEPFNCTRDLFLWALYLGKLDMMKILFKQQDQGRDSRSNMTLFMFGPVANLWIKG